MLARFTRLPLRRYMHTQTARPQNARLTRAVLGVSAVTATLLTWRLLSDPIALDSHTTTSSLQKPAVSSKPPSKATVTSSSSDSTPEPSSVPNSEISSERSAYPESTKPDKDSSDTTDGAGEQQGEGTEGSPQGGAFNPETGEINWDCPCLGGMAHGPCGEEFKEAFSCFVFSEQEPKGIDCVEKFKAMQDCFRRHPEIYSDEIMDEDEEEAGTPEAAAVATENTPSSPDGASIPQDTSTSST